MPCMAKFDCRIKNIYIGVGNSRYHGELCEGCMFWEDTPEDLEFKSRVELICNSPYTKKGNKTMEIPEWF